ncbi:hypothetical protein [Streptomyces glomeratus]|uniref:Uncharacterized protein n=1 Tax=Streptomyces glomeratus TaxID=284452 RepID=A0ABP6M571_9ACTN|nr:hypothetical protein [Streptomyces glomeratus]MCF1512512.1 hypothetical protein [Streptomyces glomeratus]
MFRATIWTLPFVLAHQIALTAITNEPGLVTAAHRRGALPRLTRPER